MKRAGKARGQCTKEPCGGSTAVTTTRHDAPGAGCLVVLLPCLFTHSCDSLRSFLVYLVYPQTAYAVIDIKNIKSRCTTVAAVLPAVWSSTHTAAA
jgi:hypothetical protein